MLLAQNHWCAALMNKWNDYYERQMILI
jgi:hypothetical protein